VGTAVSAAKGTARLLDRLEELFRTRRAPGGELDQLLPSARERAIGIAESAGDTREAELIAATSFAAEIVSGLWVERAWKREQVTALVERAAAILELPRDTIRIALYLRAAREQQLLELPPRLAIETQVRMLLAFAPIEQASVWTPAPDRPLSCIVHVGGAATSRRAREIARALVAGEEPDHGERTRLRGIPITRWRRTVAALVVHSAAEHRAEAVALAYEAAAAISPLLELDLLLDRNAARERALVESTERQLVRLGFDIHDGALQDLAALASDVRLFRKQLEEVLGGSERRDVILGRIDDLEGRVVSVDSELRELSQSLESPAAVVRPLVESIEAEVAKFGRDSGIPVHLEVNGTFEELTASQTIALARIVEEALQNVREHSGATEVGVTLTATQAMLEARVVDDGRGFDVEPRLVEAARAGHLGLIGMAERVRLLGGRLDVDSRPGGPTRITARIARWRPTTPGAESVAVTP